MLSLVVILFCLDIFNLRKITNQFFLKNNTFKYFKISKLSKIFDNNLKSSFSSFLVIISLSVSSVILITLAQYIIINTFTDVSFFELLLARSLVQILLIAPITIAGIGVREAGFLTVLSSFGYLKSDIMSFTFVLLFFQLLIFTLGVFVYFYNKNIFTNIDN